MVIDGNGVSDFSWIASLPHLRRLTLINTKIKNGDVLSKFAHLDGLFINDNRFLENYEFLVDMDVNALYLGYNGTKDLSPLYRLNKTKKLILEESMLLDIDVERIMGLHEDNTEKKRHIRVRRWIKESGCADWPTSYSINYHFLSQRKQQQN